jgi:putative transposase
MLVLEAKLKAKPIQQNAINEAIRTVQFVRNKALRFWIDHKTVSKYDLNKQSSVLAAEFSFADKLNSMARQSACERAWTAISNFYANCKNPGLKEKGYPKFQKDNRSVEYKTTGWKLSDDRRFITFTDGHKIGTLKLIGSRDLNFYQKEEIKRVRIVRRADGYYAQFCVDAERTEDQTLTGSMIGLDMGLNSFYTDSNGKHEDNPRYLRKAERRLKAAQRRVSKKFVRTKKGEEKKKQSKNYVKAKKVLALQHLKVQRQRKDHAVKLARCVIQSNDLIVYENLKIKNMVKNHCLAKSINDAGWYQFRTWLEYFGKVFGKITIAVNPAYTTQECSRCHEIVKKSLSTRTHVCSCGCVLDRDENAAINILRLGMVATGHVETQNASGDLTATGGSASSHQQVGSLKEESPCL